MNRVDYALQAVKGIKEVANNGVQEDLMQYQDNRVFEFANSSEVFEIFTSTESLSGAIELGDSDTPPLVTLNDGYSVTVQEKRFGLGYTINEKTMARDKVDSTMQVENFIAENTNQVMKEAVHYLLTEAFELLNDGFTGAKYLAPDGAAIFGSHTWASGGTFDNGVTAVLSESAIDDMEEYAGAFTDASGKPMPMNFDIIIVKKGSAAERTARKLFAESISPVAVGDINLYQGEKTIVSTPYITSANKLNWFARDSRYKNPLRVKIGQMPTMHEPIPLENQGYRVNVTGFFAVACTNMPYSYYGSTGAA
ncbi:MAG TPA: hypothetical protein PKK32_00850 [Candidatus Paceibacterota bacterium]|nr:hypothetical protein [Candidatus Paceibacterota bacterium]